MRLGLFCIGHSIAEAEFMQGDQHKRSSLCAGKTVAGRQADAAEASKAHGGELWHAQS